MNTREQKEMRRLLKFEKSKPHILDQGKETERTVWRLPDGRRHREFGPAVESKNRKLQAWYQNGQRHREDGPAVIKVLDNGKVVESYYIRGVPASSEDLLLFKEIG